MDAEVVDVTPEFRTLPDRRILYVTAQSADHANFEDTCRAAIGALFGELGAKGIAWIPGTFGVETPHTSVEESEPAYAKAFVIVEPDLEVSPLESVKEGVLPGGRELVGIHVGAYPGLLESWPLLERYRSERELRVRDGVVYDLYIDDPQNVAESEMRTEMHIPLE